MVAVDLFDYNLRTLDESKLGRLEEKTSGITEDRTRPLRIIADIGSVALPRPADFITMIEVTQYVEDPLRTIANSYNQLVDGGLMLVADADGWSGGLRYAGGSERFATEDLVEALSRANVHHAAQHTDDWPERTAFPADSRRRLEIDFCDMNILGVQKKPGTELVINTELVEVVTEGHDYKRAYYQPLAAGSPPPVEVVSTV